MAAQPISCSSNRSWHAASVVCKLLLLLASWSSCSWLADVFGHKQLACSPSASASLRSPVTSNWSGRKRFGRHGTGSGQVAGDCGPRCSCTSATASRTSVRSYIGIVLLVGRCLYHVLAHRQPSPLLREQPSESCSPLARDTATSSRGVNNLTSLPSCYGMARMPSVCFVIGIQPRGNFSLASSSFLFFGCMVREPMSPRQPPG